MNRWTGKTTWLKPTKPASCPSKRLIVCELLDKVPLTAVYGRYSTLSYCVGSLNDTASLLVNGLEFNAFRNLEHALDCVRLHWSKTNPGDELLIWVDQICINQDNNTEKSQQVYLMKHIYQGCHQVFACFSKFTSQPPTDNRNFLDLESWFTLDGIETVNDLSKYHRGQAFLEAIEGGDREEAARGESEG